MAEPRRSVRSTKGVNNRLSDIGLESASPAPASGQASKAKKKTPAKERASPDRSQTVEEENTNGSPDDIIRCVCGAKEEDEDDSRMMIQCEGCEAWQHTQCMGIPKKKIPKQYFCEVCRPENHQVLLNQLEKGEKPWEKKPTARRKGKKDSTPARGQKQDSTPARNFKNEPTPTKSEVAPASEFPELPAPSDTPVPKKPVQRRKKKQQVVAEMEMPRRSPSPVVEQDDPMDIDISQSAQEDIPNKPPEDLEKVEEDPEEEEPEEEQPEQPEEEPDKPEEEPEEPDKLETVEKPVAQEKPEEQEETEDRERTVSMELSPAKDTIESNGNGVVKEVIEDSLEPQTPQTPISATKEEPNRRDNRRDSTRSIKSLKRKPTGDSDGEYKHEDEEPHKRIRRVSAIAVDASPKDVKPSPRRASIAKPPIKRQKTEDNTPQKELVETIDELRNEGRRKVANFLMTPLIERASPLVSENELILAEGQTINKLCERLALQVEHHVYLLFFKGGELPPEYTKKVRSVAYNLRANPSLSEELLKENLEPSRLAHMTTDEMASKELKELMQKIRLESEKHNTLITETGPRIRRTHKGEELVGEVEDNEPTDQDVDSLVPPGGIIRRSDSTDEPTVSMADKSPSIAVEITESPVTAPENHDEVLRSPSRPPVADAKPERGRNFSIENVWDHIEAPDTNRIPRAMRPAVPATARDTDPKIDKDIDMLLKDDDGDATPPYSPASAMSDDDHYSPRHEEEEDEWKGRVEMNGIASLSATAALVGGPEYVANTKWSDLLTDVLHIDGRIKHDRATEYLCGQKFSKSSSLVMVSLTPTDSMAQTEFKKLFDYFKERDRYAVVGKHLQKCIKDLYIVPVDEKDSLPDWFNVLDPASSIPQNGRQGKLLIVIFVVIRNLVGLPSATPTHASASMSPYTQMRHRASDAAPPYTPIAPTPSGMHHQGTPYTPPQQAQQHNFAYQGPNAHQQQYVTTYNGGSYPPNSGHNAHPTPSPAPGSLPVPLAEMTQNLVQIFPDMDANQLMMINKILVENPEIQNDPDALAKIIERQMGGS
ncbi:uncharacterized protein H6S33_000544 [Morchella sextelata]|uniref:uncharacterized protein n=1 Tax=Morchella sextelata TaxID=1174677 RepID=UPI001D056B8D|nr:uncharacterized protein H6S33_000544 [Morchella sextelata]KAH0614908.1 hypothetical protein H6S33_000544 [Morchella sextelata]